MNVLIADDDPVCLSFVEGLLKTWGFTVTLASDGQEALHAAEAVPPPDVAILDWNMPRMDGYEVCRRLKQSMAQGIYVIMITGGYPKEEMIKPLIAGADDYIVKPFEGIDLQIHLRNATRVINLASENADLRNRLASLREGGLRPRSSRAEAAAWEVPPGEHLRRDDGAREARREPTSSIRACQARPSVATIPGLVTHLGRTVPACRGSSSCIKLAGGSPAMVSAGARPLPPWRSTDDHQALDLLYGGPCRLAEPAAAGRDQLSQG